MFYDGQHHMSHVFAPWHCIPFVTPRAAAIDWAEQEGKAIESEDARRPPVWT